ncbi:MAG: hypothetical protein AAGH40_00745 [Verrucomicrobiota bacterium]
MNKQVITMWIVWFAMLQSAFVFSYFLGDGLPKGKNAAAPMAAWIWVVCFLPLVVATILRWIVLPKIKEPQHQLTFMIIGLSMGESAVFFQLFLIGPEYPQNQIAVLIVAVLVLILMAPSYATPGIKPTKDSPQ